jgi:hypothetical protein
MIPSTASNSSALPQFCSQEAGPCQGLRGIVKGGTVIAAERGRIAPARFPRAEPQLPSAGQGKSALMGPAGNCCRHLVMAKIVARIINPSARRGSLAAGRSGELARSNIITAVAPALLLGRMPFSNGRSDAGSLVNAGKADRGLQAIAAY